MCYQFCGVPIDKLLQLDIYEYRVILINMFVFEASKSDKGREMLDQYYRIHTHRSMDTDKLTAIFGRKE